MAKYDDVSWVKEHCEVVTVTPKATRFGSVQSFSHIWFGLSGARHWLKR